MVAKQVVRHVCPGPPTMGPRAVSGVNWHNSRGMGRRCIFATLHERHATTSTSVPQRSFRIASRSYRTVSVSVTGGRTALYARWRVLPATHEHRGLSWTVVSSARCCRSRTGRQWARRCSTLVTRTRSTSPWHRCGLRKGLRTSWWSYWTMPDSGPAVRLAGRAAHRRSTGWPNAVCGTAGSTRPRYVRRRAWRC